MDAQFLAEVMDTPGLPVWISIMSWGFVLGWIFIFVRLLQGGFRDLAEVANSRYATARERWQARSAMPVRLVLLIIAAGLGAAGVAIGVFVQGAILIFIYQQALA
jgi:hypothetical protein